MGTGGHMMLLGRHWGLLEDLGLLGRTGKYWKSWDGD